MEDVVFKNKELTQREDKVNYYEDLIPVVKKYEAIIRSIKKVILNVAYIDMIFKKIKNVWGNGLQYTLKVSKAEKVLFITELL